MATQVGEKRCQRLYAQTPERMNAIREQALGGMTRVHVDGSAGSNQSHWLRNMILTLATAAYGSR